MHKSRIYREKEALGYDGIEKTIRRAVRVALNQQKIKDDCIVNIMLTDNEGIHEINKERRGVDSATDVLSFPLNDLPEGEFIPEACEYDFEAKAIALGDMVISLERCAAQAEEYGHSFQHEVSYLAVHSVLHLLGYDHLDEGERKARMREREKKIMAYLAI